MTGCLPPELDVPEPDATLSDAPAPEALEPDFVEVDAPRCTAVWETLASAATFALGPTDAGAADADAGPCDGARCAFLDDRGHLTARCSASSTALSDLESDRANCGECFRSCDLTQRCVRGACVAACTAAEPTLCGAICRNTANDRDHCGACGNRCPAGSICRSGSCAPCAPGLTLCGSACVDLQTTRTNCGACSRTCLGTACVAGRCLPDPCASGALDAGVPARSEWSDDLCGGWCGACGGRTVCIEGRCRSASPRMVAPLSTAVVTSGRPWFRWRPPPDGGMVRIEVCATRICERVERSMLAAGDAARFDTPLPPGTYYWRIRAVGGSEAPSELVWQFYVPALCNGQPEAAGFFPDVNGDGVVDTFQLIDESYPAFTIDRVLSVALGAAGGTAPPQRIAIRGEGRGPSNDRFQSGPARHVAFAGDLNGDGFGDLAVTMPYTFDSLLGWGDLLFVYLGRATGVYEGRLELEVARLDLQDHFRGPPLGDLNADGYVDLGSLGPDGLWATAGLYGGRVLTRPPFAWRSYCSQGQMSLATGDFNGDGASEVTYGLCGPGLDGATFFLVPTDRTWGWASRGPLTLGGCGLRRVSPERWAELARAYDVDDDGFDDLVVRTGRTATERVVFPGGPDGLVRDRCTRVP